MKKILAMWLVFSATLANAQTDSQFVNVNKPIFCGPLNIILTSLADKELDEKPVWTGQSESGSDFVVFVNFKTSAFTMIEMGKEVGCILGLGAKSNFFKPPSREPIKSKIN